MNMTRGVIYYAGKARIGGIGFSQYCVFGPMQQYGLTPEILAEAFRYGKEVEPNKIVYPDGDQSIVVIYRDENRLTRGNLNENKYMIITCWVQRTR
jgi:hypothetical protein